MTLASKPGGDDWATDKLMSRPDLPDDCQEYYAAWCDLHRDRPLRSISMGMGGSVELPRFLPLEAIRLYGERRKYSGDELEDFITIVRRIDDFYVELESKRIAADLRAQAARAKAKQNRR